MDAEDKATVKYTIQYWFLTLLALYLKMSSFSFKKGNPEDHMVGYATGTIGLSALSLLIVVGLMFLVIKRHKDLGDDKFGNKLIGPIVLALFVIFAR